MSQRQSDINNIFWIDDPVVGEELSSALRTYTSTMVWSARIFIALFGIIGILIPVVIFSYLSRTLVWVWLIIIAFAYIFYFYQKRNKALDIKKVYEIQKKARENTGASMISSAVHVAGHPLLARNQPIVLALIDDHLSIFGYESSQPIDTIYLDHLITLHTVVYDDERIPHIDIIDSTAQALQMTFNKNSIEITCLMRQMRQVRPIDWYHAIKQVIYTKQVNDQNTL